MLMTTETLAPGVQPGETFRDVRIRKGWGQAELARELAIRPESVWGWEKRGRMPLPRYRRRIATLFEIPIEAVMNPDFWKASDSE
jgi:transcriptional regulator with XRE-family HTH domain